MKMKELESRTGVNREAIRYYIREGLLPQPKKPKRNVAEYQAEHVERTRLIKRLQEEHFLPLRIVKEILDKVARAPAMSQPALAQLLPMLIKDTDDQEPSALTNISALTGLSMIELNSMAEVGAITISQNNTVSARDAEIVRLWASARAIGFTAERGYDTEFLQRYVSLAEQWAELEAAHFLQAFQDVSEDVASEDAAALIGARGIALSGRLLSLMHTNAVLTKVDELATDGG